MLRNGECPAGEDSITADSADKYDKYEDYAEKYVPRSGDSQKGPKNARRARRSSSRARKFAVQNSQEARREDARLRLAGLLQDFPPTKDAYHEDLQWERYLLWLNSCLMEGSVIILEPDVSYKYMKSGAHAGGQNVNKVSSAVMCTHEPTHISVRNEETRNQPDNKRRAVEVLEEKLQNHLADWKEYLSPDGDRNASLAQITPDDLINILAD